MSTIKEANEKIVSYTSDIKTATILRMNEELTSKERDQVIAYMRKILEKKYGEE